MDTGKDFQGINSLIQEKLSYKYNKSVTKVFFNTCKILSGNNSIQLKSTILTFLNKIPASEITYNHWRIPQTRIFVDALKSVEFELIFVSGVDFLLLSAQNASGDKLELSFSTGNKSYEVQIIQRKNFIKLISDENIFSGSEYSFLQTKINEERSSNPVNLIQTTNVDILKLVDETWSLLENIGLKDKIELQNSSNAEARLLVITELYLLLGKTEQLDYYFSNPDSTENIDFVRKYYRNSLGKENFPIPDQKDEILNIFLNLENRTTDQLQFVQDFWTKASLPGRKFYLKNEFSKKPLTIIAFLILSYKCDFWWKGIAFEYLSGIIKSSDYQVFKLLLILKEIYLIPHITYVNGFVKFSSPFFVKNNYTLIHPNFQISKNIRNNKEYSHFKIKTLSISLDKSSQLLYSPKNQHLQLGTQLNRSNSVKLIYGQYTVEIPLLWRNFVVHVDLLRLKILFKKNRFQVSVKGSKNIMGCVINNTSFSFTETQYHRFYIDASIENISNSIVFYDDSGRSFPINAWPAKDSHAFTAISVFDKYGLIQDYVQYQKQGSVKSKILKCDNQAYPVEIQQAFLIRIPKSDVIKFSPGFNVDFISAIMFTPSELLQQQLTLYIDYRQSEVSKMWFRHFGFYPKIDSIENIDKQYFRYSILIEEKHHSSLKYIKISDKLDNSGRKSLEFKLIEKFEKWLADNFPLL